MAEPRATPEGDEPARLEPAPAVLPALPAPPSSDPIPGFEMLPDEPPQGLVRRFITVQRHLFGLMFGALAASVRSQVGAERSKRRSFRLALLLARLTAWLARPFLDKEIVSRPFPVQLRRRLEILGPTYIKLGQV